MLLPGFVLAVALAVQAPVPPPSPSAYVGSWNVRITDAADTFVSGGIQIEKNGDALTAGLVWRWGSYAPATSVEVRDGALRIVRGAEPGKQDAWDARLEGGVLKGVVTYPDGKTHHFEGRRAPALAPGKAPRWGRPVRLFDGKTLAGWRLRDPAAKNGWAVVNGELAVVDPKDNADFVSARTFRDFKLHLEFNVDAKSNSGVYLRGRYEIQILDNPDGRMALDTHGCGAVYSRMAPSADAAKAAGEWQTLDVELAGRQVTVRLNGTLIVQGTIAGVTGGALSPFEDEPGPLMLQGDHGKVRFRNIMVTPAR